MEQKIVKPFYDLDEIKKIPIILVAKMFDVPVTEKNGVSWGALRNEKTASVKFYSETNTYCDFGMGNKGGNVINLVANIKNCDNETAINVLAQMFDVEPLNKVSQGLSFELSDLQYLKIGITAKKATMNFEVDVDKYGIEKSTDFVTKYDLTVNKLKQTYPKVYENMLKHRAIKFVYTLKMDFFAECYHQICFYEMVNLPPVTILQDIKIIDYLTKQADEVSCAEKILKCATKNTSLTYTNTAYNVEKTILDILKGNISVEVGNILYIDLKANEKKNNGFVLYKELPYEVYEKSCDLKDIRHTAFLKYDKEKGKMINMAYSKTNAKSINNALEQGHSIERCLKSR